MTDLSLVNYVRQLLAMGYDIGSVRTRLIASGYNPAVVDDAINYIYGGQQQEVKKSNIKDIFLGRKFIVVFGLIIALVVVSATILLFASGEKSQISFSVSVESSVVFPGDEISFRRYVENADKGTLAFKYEILEHQSQKIIAYSSESFQPSAASGMSSIKVPESAASGEYALKATLIYGIDEFKDSFSFYVEEISYPVQNITEPAENTSHSENLTLPENDSDYDNDGIPDDTDNDDDNDGILDSYDLYPYDRDNDGIEDSSDSDNDNDGTPDTEDPYPYDYDNDGKEDRNDDDLGRSYEIPSEQELSEKCTDSIGCNDYDICTTDSCSEGVCRHIRISPCCGNMVCESGESHQSCPEDCSEEISQFPGEEQINEIMKTAESNPEKAASMCEQIPESYISDSCFLELAKTSANPAFCDTISSSDTKDKCYIYFVMANDMFEFCEKIEKRMLKNSCYSIKSVRSFQSQIPS